MPDVERPFVTYILPTTAWASLLDIIAREAPPGAMIEVHTPDMQALVAQTLLTLGRHDVQIRLGPRTGVVDREAARQS